MISTDTAPGRARRAVLPAILTAFGIAAAVTALAGCSGKAADPLATETVRQAVTQSQGQVADAPGIVIKGTLPPNTAGLAVGVNLTFSADDRCSGTISVPREGTISIVTIGNQGWIKESSQFINSAMGSAAEQAIGEQVLGGKWLHDTSASSDAAGIMALCSRSEYDGATSTSSGPASANSTYQDKPALLVADTAIQERLTLSDTSPARIVRAVRTVNGRAYTITLTYASKAPVISAPPTSVILPESDSKSWGF
jgi:hypothetical protein